MKASPSHHAHRVAIIGDGGWGTALALGLHQYGHRVTIWGPFPDYITEIRHQRFNPLYLPNIPIPEGICWTSDRAEAVKQADVVVLAIPTKYFRSTLAGFAPLIPEHALVMSVAKGLDPETLERMSVVAEEVLGHAPVAALSGPSLADEVARGIPTAVVIACADVARAKRLQQIFMSSRFRVYTSDDVIGVELGGALKNVIALAVGASDGIGFGDNTRAAIITRGMAEMSRLGVALGAHPSTFAGLSGMGDLIVTCTSRLSRNHTVGERLGRGEKIEAILAGMKQVAEGVTNAATARTLARRHGVDAPIIEQVYAVIYEDKDPCHAVTELMGRDARPERD